MYYVINESIPQCIVGNNYLLNEYGMAFANGSSDMFPLKYLHPSDFRCILTKFFVTLQYKGIIAFVGLALLLIIILISIFGKIKENYRWFILNQAIWDLSLTFETYCYNQTHITFYGKTMQKQFCFYNDYANYFRGNPTAFSWLFFFYTLFWANPMTIGAPNRSPSDSYSSLFCLSMSRFLCLFASHFYEKWTKGYRVFIWIIAVNTFCWMTKISELYFLRVYNKIDLLHILINCLGLLKPIIFSFVSIIPIFFVFYRIFKHSIHQRKNHRKEYSTSLRISIVLLLQLLMNILIAFVEYQRLIDVIVLWFFYPKFNTFSLSFNIPWLSTTWGLGSLENFESLRMLKVLIESFLVLSVLTGYRESIFFVIKYIYFKFKTPIARIHPQANGSWVGSSSVAVQNNNGAQ